MDDPLKVVVTGDVDAGKSTLIGRCLHDSSALYRKALREISKTNPGNGGEVEFAYLLDSFEEERVRQLTMDTTQVLCKNRGRQILFIDVPGHQELLGNMLCGSSFAEYALLVIDVEKPLAEQTCRHAFLLKFLGIAEVLVAINKLDTVDFSRQIFDRSCKELRTVWDNVGITPAGFVPVSAKYGDNLLTHSKKIPWYKGPAIFDALTTAFSRRTQFPYFRFPVQDVYESAEEKIAVGRIISGRIRKGDCVTILPTNQRQPVKEIKIFDKKTSSAETPQSIGLILGDMNMLERGQVIAKEPVPEINRQFRARIVGLSAFSMNDQLCLQCCLAETPVRICQVKPALNDSVLGAHQSAEILLTAETAVVTEKYRGDNALGRFILKNSRNQPCAMGIII